MTKALDKIKAIEKHISDNFYTVILSRDDGKFLTDTLKEALQVMQEIDKDFGTDHCDGNTMLVHEFLAKIDRIAGDK